MADNKTKKVSWNASQGIIMEVSNRRAAANSYFIEGNIVKAMNTLVSIKQSVIQSFDDDERTELRNIEERFNKFSKYLSKSNSNSFNNEIRKAHLLAKEIASKVYAKYNDKLMDLLEDRGYLIGEQTDASAMKF